MPRSTASVADEVTSRARGVDLFLRRIERLHADHRLPRRDVERAYAGGFLEFYAFAERAIERLFIGLLRGRLVSPHAKVRALIAVESDSVAASVVTGDRSYVDWFPYARYTIKRAEAFFSSGRPFSVLDKAEASAFERAAIVRNALAHQSASAIRQFKERMVADKTLPPDQRRPSGYLRGFHAVGQTRMNLILAEVATTFRKLCG